jgi:hypothetical protein
MPELDLGYQPSREAIGDAVLGDVRPLQSELGVSSDRAAAEAGAASAGDEIARDIAEIERAAAVLRQAEPTLEMWTESWPGKAAATLRKPRPVWLLIGLLWLSTALVAAGAVATIAHLAG